MAKLLRTLAIVKKYCKTSLITTKLNFFDLNPNIKITLYPIMCLALTFLYILSSPKYPNNWGRRCNSCGGSLAYLGENNISKTNSWLLNLIYFNIKPNLKLLYIYMRLPLTFLYKFSSSKSHTNWGRRWNSCE